MKIYVINGPNLNMLGIRDSNQYGNDTLKEIEKLLTERFSRHDFSFFQSNVEGELVNVLQAVIESGYDGLIVNFGGYTHTSVAIRDALELISLPVVEVHLSNIHAREDFRQKSLTGAISNGIITGFGKNSYVLGVNALEMLSSR